MRRPLLPIVTLLAAAAALAGSAAGAAGTSRAAGASPNEVLSIEDGQGRFEIRGRGYLNMRIEQGAVTIVDQTPGDRYSPYLGGVPRGRTSGVSGRDINLYVLGGRYKVVVRGSGINISARGDGVVLLTGELDATGTAGTIRIGDVVRPVAAGDARAAFGPTVSSPSGASGSSSPSDGGQGGRDEGRS